MPKFNKDPGLEQFDLKTSHFGFSATRLDDLAQLASEFTLVSLLIDDSSSVAAFKGPLTKAVKDVIGACDKSPRKDNLLIRVCTFSNTHNEVHGFKRLQAINPDDYDTILGHGGMTALFDSMHNAVTATSAYSKHLMENDYSVNGIVIVLTDGEDNQSKQSKNAVKLALQDVIQQETIESLVSILVGVNSTGTLDSYLSDFKDEAGITQYVGIGDATPGKIAKLAKFVSKSISAQSQSLGTGGPSKSLSF